MPPPLAANQADVARPEATVWEETPVWPGFLPNIGLTWPRAASGERPELVGRSEVAGGERPEVVERSEVGEPVAGGDRRDVVAPPEPAAPNEVVAAPRSLRDPRRRRLS